MATTYNVWGTYWMDGVYYWQGWLEQGETQRKSITTIVSTYKAAHLPSATYYTYSNYSSSYSAPTTYVDFYYVTPTATITINHKNYATSSTIQTTYATLEYGTRALASDYAISISGYTYRSATPSSAVTITGDRTFTIYYNADVVYKLYGTYWMDGSAYWQGWLDSGSGRTSQWTKNEAIYYYKDSHPPSGSYEYSSTSFQQGDISYVDFYFVTPKYYTVKYNANGGTSTPSDQTERLGVDISLAAAIFKNSTSWYDSISYTATFDGNGGTPQWNSDQCTWDIPKTRTYSFKSWRSNGTDYQAGARFTSNTETTYTMTAQWNYTDTAGTPVLEEERILPNCTRYGYTFAGWYVNGVKKGNAGDSYRISANTTLVASWQTKLINTKIIYDDNGGTGGPGESSYLIQEGATVTKTISNTIPTKTGYTFLGWSKWSSATFVHYDPGDDIELTAGTNVPLYAVWQINQYQITIHYYSSGTTSRLAPDETYTVNYGTVVKTTDYNKEIEGQILSSVVPNVDTTVTQNCEFIRYYVVRTYVTYLYYDVGEGTGAPNTQSYITLSTGGEIQAVVSQTIPIRLGYEFIGWSKWSSATFVHYDPGDDITLIAGINTTLYAVWQIRSYTITIYYRVINTNRDIISPKQYIVNYGTEITTQSYIESIAQYVYVSSSPNETKTVPEYTSFIRYYRPVNINVTVTSDKDFAGTVTGSGVYPYGGQCTITATVIDQNYIFKGWYDAIHTITSEPISTDPNYTFTVWDHIDIQGRFKRIVPIDNFFWGHIQYWRTNTEYFKDDVVLQNDEVWQANRHHESGDHFNILFWDKLTEVSKDYFIPSNIREHRNIEELRATCWNYFLNRVINECEKELGQTVSTLPTVVHGQQISASIFNNLKVKLLALDPTVDLPDDVVMGQEIKYYYFDDDQASSQQTNYSIRTALNRIIDLINTYY